MKTAAVTGASGYTGKYIARRLLDAGVGVVNLTGHPGRTSDIADRVTTAPLDFDNSAELIRSLRGVDTLFNTYWIRFEHGASTFEGAVRNSEALFGAAAQAGVSRIVHVSITNPSGDSPLPYFRGKAQVEEALIDTGVPYGIVRPTVIFGSEDIFINNIAWMLRRFPLFGVPGDGRYRLQPVYVDDVAAICVDAGRSGSPSITVDAAGPEILTFIDLLRSIRGAVRARSVLMPMPAGVALGLAKIVSLLVRDVVLTGTELTGLEQELIVSEEEPRGTTKFSDWIAHNGSRLGRRYSSELKRHYVPERSQALQTSSPPLQV